MIAVGVIGCGGLFERRHAPVFEAMPERARVVATADTSAERRDLIGDRFAVKPEARFADYREMLATRRLDVIDIAVPIALREEVALAVAQAGMHLLCESPLAPTPEAAQRIVKAVAENAVKLVVIHEEPEQPALVNGDVEGATDADEELPEGVQPLFEIYFNYLETGLGECPGSTNALADLPADKPS
jgi:predicted dehydrogenase